jgi:VWFA-related protein
VNASRAGALALVLLVTAPLLALDPQQPQLAYRTRTTLVPIDVRVLDKDGKPVTDLTQKDFIVFEDGIRQEIRTFSAQALMPEPAGGAGVKPTLTREPEGDLKPQTRRIFLVVLGRGRLQPPAKGVDAVLGLIHDRLLPQDQIAVMAYNRATDFTADHERIEQVVERFKKKHEDIESKLQHYFSGLTAVYGGKQIPTYIQKEIDEVFNGPGVRELPASEIPGGGRMEQDTRRTTDLLQGVSTMSTTDGALAASTEMSFDDYVSTNRSTMQDLSNLYTGIDYLRFINGEKHLVFVSENGLFLPRVEDDHGLAAAASDARVVIDTIQTGGVAVPPLTRGGGPIPRPTIASSFAVRTLSTVAALTGGQSSSYEYASKGVARVDQSTRFDYLLGYNPSNTNWNGRYRRLVVRVNRPGVSVFFRHGYYALTELAPTDQRTVATFSRISAAGSYDKEVHDLNIKATVSVVQGTAGATMALVDMTIDASRVTLKEENGLRVGALNIAIFCGDPKENIIGQLWQRMDLKLGAETYQKYVSEGIPFTARIPVRGTLQYVKAVVYDYSADLVGSVIVKVK